MMNFINSRNVYRIVIIVFLICIVVKIQSQFKMLNSYNQEISSLNSKIEMLKEEKTRNEEKLDDSKENNESIARKDLKMYYPNETPYKGY